MTAAIGAEIRQALAAAKLSPAPDAGQTRNCSVSYALLYPAKQNPHAREDAAASLRSQGWKQQTSYGTDEIRLTRDDWQVFVTRQDVGKIQGEDSRSLEIDAGCV